MEELLAHLNPAGLVARVLSRIDTIEHKVDAIRSGQVDTNQAIDALKAKVDEVGAFVGGLKSNVDQLQRDLIESRANDASDAQTIATLQAKVQEFIDAQKAQVERLQSITQQVDTFDDPAAPPAT